MSCDQQIPLERAFAAPYELSAQLGRPLDVTELAGGDAGAVWTSAADGRVLLKQVAALPGFREQKAKILVALLVSSSE